MCMTTTPPAAATPSVPPPPVTGSGPTQQLDGLVPVLHQLTSALSGLVAALGGAGALGQAAPPAPPGDALPPAPPLPGSTSGGGGAMGAPIATQAPGGTVDPSTVTDKTGTGGLTPAALRGLEEAHRFGLPLVSGKRSGGGGSDHDHGNAIDVGTLPIGAASSSHGTPQMQAFAEHMRQQGKAGNLDVTYVILDGKIA